MPALLVLRLLDPLHKHHVEQVRDAAQLTLLPVLDDGVGLLLVDAGHLARNLVDLGYREVAIFFGGSREWERFGFRMQRGAGCED